jgi:crossover junction endodeoxyribonuclease RusA
MMLTAHPDFRRRPPTIPGLPFSVRLPVPPSARDYWRVWRNRAVRTKEAEAYRDCVARAVGSRALLQGDVAITVHWYRSARRGDLDNRLKILFDALQGAVYQNDNQVIEIHAYRHEDAGNPRVEVGVELRTP